MTRLPSTARGAYRALTDHKYYRYRGCAPDPDQPDRAAGNPDVPLNAWLPHTGDGAEEQRDRIDRERAAISVCEACPVRALCAAYACTETDGQLTEPEGVWGGMLALDRHRELIGRRTAEPTTPAVTEVTLAECRREQKQTVLSALASHWDEEIVAQAAGMDLRTTNWHRSSLCGLLGLDRETATRAQLLAAAAEHGVLPAGVRVVREPSPVAAAPTTDGARQRRIAAGAPIQLTLPLAGALQLRRRRRPRTTTSRPRPAARIVADTLETTA
ncbi:WhiB family transcriptional regulator [Streptomyces diastaticus]